VDWRTWLGIVVTIIVGGPGIYVLIKRSYPGQITFVIENCLALFETIVKNIPELSVTYKNSPVNKGIVLLRGVFLNTGTKDISKEMIEEDLRLELPEACEWLQAKVLPSTPSVRATIEQETRTLTFKTGLFRCREIIRFECLAKIKLPDNENLTLESLFRELLRCTYRIADTQSVKTVHYPSLQESYLQSLLYMFPMFVLPIMGVVFAIYTFVIGTPSLIYFHMANDNGKRIEVTAAPQVSGNVLVKGVDEYFSKVMPASAFFALPDLQPQVVPYRSMEFVSMFNYSVMVIIPIFFIVPFFLKQRRLRRIRLLLGLFSKEGVPSPVLPSS
jgi:hypothetical protein